MDLSWMDYDWWADIGLPAMVGIGTIALAVASVIAAFKSASSARDAVAASNNAVASAERANQIAIDQHTELLERELARVRAHAAARAMAWFTRQVAVSAEGKSPAERDGQYDTTETIAVLSESGFQSATHLQRDLSALVYESAGLNRTTNGSMLLVKKYQDAVEWVTAWDKDPDGYEPRRSEEEGGAALKRALEIYHPTMPRGR